MSENKYTVKFSEDGTWGVLSPENSTFPNTPFAWFSTEGQANEYCQTMNETKILHEPRMKSYIITEDQLNTYPYENPVWRNKTEEAIRSRPLSDELEKAYRNGFNDGQAEGMVV